MPPYAHEKLKLKKTHTHKNYYLKLPSQEYRLSSETLGFFFATVKPEKINAPASISPHAGGTPVLKCQEARKREGPGFESHLSNLTFSVTRIVECCNISFL